MENKELQHLVEEVSLKYFARRFEHQAIFNSRLRTTGGRYHLSSHNLDFNPKILASFGLDEFIGVIKHELCHYHLHLEGKGYRHQDQDFKKMLKQVAGSRYVKNIESVQQNVTRWRYQCLDCSSFVDRKRRFNVQKYRCGRCGGILELRDRIEISSV